MRLVQRQFPIAQPLVHLDDVALPYVQSVGEQFRVRRESLPFELGLLFFEIVEQLPLVLGRPDFDQSIGVQEIAENVGPRPPGGIGVKADVLRRVELLDRLHQADVAFLNQVHVVGAGVEIFGGNRDRHAQVGHDEFHGGVAAALRVIFMEQAQFFFFGEIGIPADFGQVLLERRDRHHGHGICGWVSADAGLNSRAGMTLADLFIRTGPRLPVQRYLPFRSCTPLRPYDRDYNRTTCSGQSSRCPLALQDETASPMMSHGVPET